MLLYLLFWTEFLETIVSKERKKKAAFLTIFYNSRLSLYILKSKVCSVRKHLNNNFCKYHAYMFKNNSEILSDICGLFNRKNVFLRVLIRYIEVHLRDPLHWNIFCPPLFLLPAFFTLKNSAIMYSKVTIWK